MINICHIADHLNGEIDGVFKHISSIIKLTGNKNFKHYLCFEGNKQIEEEIKRLGGNLIILPEIRSKLPFLAVIKFIKLCIKNDIEIIHAHFLKSYIIAGLGNVFMKKKVIYNYHGLFIRNEFYNLFERALYQLFHFIICQLKGVQLALVPSKESMNELISETKLFPNISQYYNGISCDFRNPQINLDIVNKIDRIKSFKFVFIGRIEEEKRVDRALSILNNLKNEGVNIHLFIFGSGSLINNITKLCNDLELDKFVSFLGVVKNPTDYLNYFDCLILTSDREGMPFVVWESMSQGLPIISSSVGGITEILNDANCGLHFYKESIFDASEKAKAIISDSAFRKRLGTNGKNAVTMKYNIENFKQFIDNCYINLANVN